VRKLCREQGIGVLWATHLIDEVEPGDQVAVLHKGVILADGREDEVSANAGAETIREAFQTLTGIGGAP
jgi:ABC-2 type transport system ATP-binding protein